MSVSASSPLLSRRAALYADPAAHSLSPQMHRAAFAWAGLAGEYDAVRVRADELPEQVKRLRGPEMYGANLSLPHKEAALPLLDELTEVAARIGAVNTIINRHGSLIGDNTDAPGLLLALSDAGMAPGSRGAPIVVLGAGGAARAAVYAACVGLEREVYVVNRTRARAEELVQQWTSQAPQAEFQPSVADLSEVPWGRVELIINSSSAGLNAPDESPLPGFDFGSLPAHARVYDMVYKPAETRLMREARAAGHRAENGLGMLAHQARLAFAAWTGADVPAQVFIRAALGGAAQ